jgi:aryl-alcohol dehydrogenase-like predicted oxidoreductase
MRTRALGSSGLTITEIGLGTNAVGGHNLYADLREEDGIALVRRALDLGVTHFDTADVYGLGRSEELLGQALGARSKDVVVATKGGNVFNERGKEGVSNEPAYLRRALEASLRRLRREYVDVYYVHRPDGRTPVADAFGAVLRLVEEGKVRAAALSNFDLAGVREAAQAGPIAAVQNEYHLFNRDVERDLLPFCAERGIAFVPWGPLAFGILGGRYDRDFRLDPRDWRNRLPQFAGENFPRVLGVVDELRAIAGRRGAALPHVALRWLLARPGVAGVIAGAKTPAQVEVNVAADGLDLTVEEIRRIDDLTRPRALA